jgi:glyoxylase-like metal-dependent hydrolase (beta-lactamase superfamily II)/rhodanese-related sulfurtransferase
MRAQEEASDRTPTIEVKELREWLERGEPVTIVDVRDAEAHSEWTIPGSLHVDASDALKAGTEGPLAELRPPPDRPVVAVCNRGNTSRIAAGRLRARGIQAFSLRGGMKAWSLAWNLAEVQLPGRSVSSAGLADRSEAGAMLTPEHVRVLQLRRTGKGCLSYLVGSDGKAAVIDPSLDPEVYLDLAQESAWTITDVLDTHIHADHLSRARLLADRTRGTLRLPAQQRVSFPFTAVQEGDVVTVGAAHLTALRVPGHTMESTAFLLAGQALFTGDTLFLEGVGRPDLEASPEETRQRAQALQASLRRIVSLAPELLVLPAHTNHPVEFDHRPLSASLGELRERLELLNADASDFVQAILSRLPPTPPNHHVIVKLNEAGELPAGDLTDLEAGANRCAISG